MGTILSSDTKLGALFEFFLMHLQSTLGLRAEISNSIIFLRDLNII